MDETFGGGHFQTHDDSTVGAKSDQKGEGVVPLLIAQILSTEDQQFHMWNMTFGMISSVVIVRGIESASTRITYLLEDHTGQIEAHYWIEEGDSLKSPDVMVNSYARVYGTIRKYAGKKTIMIFKMVPVSSINEVTTHLLEVLNARYKAEEFSKKGFSDASNDIDMKGLSMNQDSANDRGLGEKQFAVFQVIRNETKNSNNDVGLDVLQKKFSHMSKQELESIIDFLVQEGHIYPTTDSHHFLCTDIM